MKVSRLNSIEQYVISRETVSIDELCEVFGVSKNTIRRDLNELEQRGHITKVYGGVTATVPSGAVPTPIRSGLNQIDKSLIGGSQSVMNAVRSLRWQNVTIASLPILDESTMP